MDQPPKPRRAATAGSFKPGQSGNPTGGKAKTVNRRDGWLNSATGHGTSRDRRTLTRYGVDIVTDLEAMQMWRSEWLAAKVIEAEPEESHRRGWDLSCDDKELSEKINTRAEELGVDGALTMAGEYEGAYGGAAIYPVLDGALGDPSTPLDEGRIADVLALHVLEPRELQPVSYYTTLGHPKFNQPETYRFIPLTGGRGGATSWQTIHESRLVIFPGIRVSKQTQPGQREGWGDSKLSRPRSVIAGFGLSWATVETLLTKLGAGILAMDGFAELSAQNAEQVMASRFSAMAQAMSAIGMTVIDVKDTYTATANASLTGVDSILMQQLKIVAAACGIPLSVLLDEFADGLASKGDASIRNWYAKIENGQTKRYKPRREQIFRLLFKSTAGPSGGKEPASWSCTPRPLWTPSEDEQATTRKTDMERAKIAIDSGVASADDVATSFYGGDTYSPDIVIDWKAREAQKKIDEEHAAALEQDPAALAAMGRGSDPTTDDSAGADAGDGEISDEELAALEADDEDDADTEWDLEDDEGAPA